ncbi:MAG: ABC transporter ATP-binding protein [Nocardioides sp.]|uniref:ABC transporter ATP-binding protein n=1 Tax=Nocardioides sp. TaxID=35761 RepID=UPI0039E71455
MKSQVHKPSPASPPAEEGGSVSGPILEVVDLVAGHGTNQVVKGISFSMAEGEFVTLLGPSGCGKTTTLRCVAGLHRTSGGSIRIDGRTMADASTHVRPERRGLNMVFQSYALWPHMSVAGNIAYALRAVKVPRAEIPARVEEVLELVGLGGYGDRSASALSGGQQQRVVLARGLATRPRLLLLDEPLSNLDSELRAKMRTEIADLQRRLGLSMLYVTHDRTEALALSDRVVVMRDGVVQQAGPPGELYTSPRNRFVAQALGPVNVVPATVVGAGPHGTAQLSGVPEGPTISLAPGYQEARVGQRIELLIRPEALTVSDSSVPGVGEFAAEVEIVEFLGNRTELTARAGAVPLRLEVDGRPDQLAPGGVVVIGLRKDHGRDLVNWQPAE